MTSGQQQANTTSITTPTDREIRIERVFEAPRDRVLEPDGSETGFRGT